MPPQIAILVGGSAFFEHPNSRLRRVLRSVSLPPTTVARVRELHGALYREREGVMRRYVDGRIDGDRLFEQWNGINDRYWSHVQQALPPTSVEAFRESSLRLDLEVGCLQDLPPP